MSNSIGYNGRLEIITKYKNGKTTPAKVFFSSPYKLTNFFQLENGGIEYILMSASAGIMAKDYHEIEIEVGAKSNLALSSQSFEKIHNMENGGSATRNTVIKINENAYLKYMPLPTIPFAGSAFTNTTKITLTPTSRLIYIDILSCGRALRGEKFAYRYYKSLTNIYLNDTLIYRDNTVFEPEKQNMQSIGMFENYTHLSNVLIYGFSLDEHLLQEINNYLAYTSITGAITKTSTYGYLIRIFDYSAEKLIRYNNHIIKLIEHH